AWEYKGKRKDLHAAYVQLLQYREALENPPLLVVCDLDRFEIHTNFTGTSKQVHRFALKDLIEAPAEPLRILRAVMSSPETLKPTTTRGQITEEVPTERSRASRRGTDRIDPHHEVHKRSTFNRFAGLGTLHALRTLVFRSRTAWLRRFQGPGTGCPRRECFGLPRRRRGAHDHQRVHRALQHPVADRAARASDARGRARGRDGGMTLAVRITEAVAY